MDENKVTTTENEIVLYRPNETITIEVRLENDTIWLAQAQIAELFGVGQPAISKHIKNIYSSGELTEKGTYSILEYMGNDGLQKYVTKYYNLDMNLARLYGVETRVLNQAVKRNIERFPERFMFQLTDTELIKLVTICDQFNSLKHSSSFPYAFTEHGVTMLASVLKSDIAVQISIKIVDALKGVIVYFADPYVSWQKGLVEYTNKLIRQYIPKGADFDAFSPNKIMEIQRKINIPFYSGRICLQIPHKTITFALLLRSGEHVNN